MSPKEIALVLACDDAYFFHLKGLVASMGKNAPSLAGIDRFCISPGLSQENVNFLMANGINYVHVSADIFQGPLRDLITKLPYTFCQFIRPLFPRIVTGYASYLYMDCDMWVQDDALLPSIRECLSFSNVNVVAAPQVSHHYTSTLYQLPQLLGIQSNWVYGSYEQAFAIELAKRSFFSSGLFAMPGDTPFWDEWWVDIQEIAPRIDMTNALFNHFSEQTAFNGVIARSRAITPLDPLYNFHCNAGPAMRDPQTGKVRACLSRPMTDIHVVHLAGWSTLADKYREYRLVYEE